MAAGFVALVFAMPDDTAEGDRRQECDTKTQHWLAVNGSSCEVKFPASNSVPTMNLCPLRWAAMLLLLLAWPHSTHGNEDRKSTRLNSSHSQISYAVFCLKKKK